MNIDPDSRQLTIVKRKSDKNKSNKVGFSFKSVAKKLGFHSSGEESPKNWNEDEDRKQETQ